MKKIPIKLIEDHDGAYRFWKRLGLSDKPLVHLDAHIDFNFHPVKPTKETVEEAKSKEDLIRQLSTNLMYKELNIKEESLTSIGNYIYPAMRDGIVRNFYWIIPGDRHEFKRSLKNLHNMLKSFLSRDPLAEKKIVKENGMLKTKIYRRNVVITTLENLPENITGALLDIDVDFLTTDTFRKGDPAEDIGKRFPWILPEELVSKLNKKNIEPSCITIAYSVNGGFTPLIYKFLGDELAIFFRCPSAKLKEIILAKNKGLALFDEGKLKEAIDILEELLRNVYSIKTNAMLRSLLPNRHCEGAKRPKQSHQDMSSSEIAQPVPSSSLRLLQSSLRDSLAMTSEESPSVAPRNDEQLRFGNKLLRNKLKAHIAFMLFRCFVKLNAPFKAKYYYNAAITSDKTYRVKDNNYGPLHLRRRGNIRKAEEEFAIILSADKNDTYALSGLAGVFMNRKNFKKAKMLFKKAYTADKKNREAILGLGSAELRLKNYKSALKILRGYRPGNGTHFIHHSLLAQAYEGLGRVDEALAKYKLACRFGMDLNLYLKLFKLLGKIGIPEHHREWIETRIDTYKKYRNNFLSSKGRLKRKLSIETIREREKALNRIDRVLKNVW